MIKLLLDSFDLEPPFAQRRLTVLTTARCGARSDWLWVRVEPSFAVGPSDWLPGMAGFPPVRVLDVVAIAPRNVGVSLEAGPWPVHVYVCRANTQETLLAPEFSPDDITIEYWGIVTLPGPPTASHRD